MTLTPNLRGALWMLASAVGFTAMTTLIKFLGPGYPAALQTFALPGGKVEEAQRQRAGTVADPHQQHRPSSALDVGVQHLALHHRLITGAQRPEGHDPGPILIADGEMKQQVLDGFDTKTLQPLRQARPDALEAGDQHRKAGRGIGR